MCVCVVARDDILYRSSSDKNNDEVVVYMRREEILIVQVHGSTPPAVFCVCCCCQYNKSIQSHSVENQRFSSVSLSIFPERTKVCSITNFDVCSVEESIAIVVAPLRS